MAILNTIAKQSNPNCGPGWELAKTVILIISTNLWLIRLIVRNSKCQLIYREEGVNLQNI